MKIFLHVNFFNKLCAFEVLRSNLLIVWVSNRLLTRKNWESIYLLTWQDGLKCLTISYKICMICEMRSKILEGQHVYKYQVYLLNSWWIKGRFFPVNPVPLTLGPFHSLKKYSFYKYSSFFCVKIGPDRKSNGIEVEILKIQVNKVKCNGLKSSQLEQNRNEIVITVLITIMCSHWSLNSQPPSNCNY